MDLYLRKVIHPQARDNYRVLLKTEDDELEIGSIGIKFAAGADYFWAWAIDTVIPMRAYQTSGRGKDRADCMRLFKAAWLKFSEDQANLTLFLAEKRRTRRRDS